MSASRVVLDIAELKELDELTEFCMHRVRAIGRLLGELQPGLQLTDRVAPDETASAALRTALDACTTSLTPLGTACAGDNAYVADVRKRALAADAGSRRRMPYADVQRLLDGLTPTTPPAQIAVLEALLIGGLRTKPPARREGAGAPRPPGPASTSQSAKVRAIVRMAKSQVGNRESGNNRTKYGAWYGMNGVAWCAIFVSWVFAKAGSPLPSLQGRGSKGFAGVQAGAEALRRRGKLYRTPKVGDIWLRRGPTWQQDHTGIVVAVHENGSFTTVEGNASDKVLQRTHGKGDGEKAQSYGFGRP